MIKLERVNGANPENLECRVGKDQYWISKELKILSFDQALFSWDISWKRVFRVFFDVAHWIIFTANETAVFFECLLVAPDRKFSHEHVFLWLAVAESIKMTLLLATFCRTLVKSIDTYVLCRKQLNKNYPKLCNLGTIMRLPVTVLTFSSFSSSHGLPTASRRVGYTQRWL